MCPQHFKLPGKNTWFKKKNVGIYCLRYVVHSISFPNLFFIQAFKIVIDSWKFTMLLLYILWADWLISMISGSNEHLQQQLEYTLLKPDWRSLWISKMQSGREDTVEERYAIKFCFKLGKNVTKTYVMLQTAFRPSCLNRASVFEWHKRSNMTSIGPSRSCWNDTTSALQPEEITSKRTSVSCVYYQ